MSREPGLAMPRTLIAAYEAPGWGGAATSAYSLHRRLLEEGQPSCFVCLTHPADEIFLRYSFGYDFANPEGLQDCSYVRIDEPHWRLHEGLLELIERQRPQVLLGVGLVASRLLQLTESGVPDVFLASGSAALRGLLTQGYIRDANGFRRGVADGVQFPRLDGQSAVRVQEEAAQACDRFVMHSPLLREAMRHYRPDLVRKAHSRDLSRADLVVHESSRYLDKRRPFAERDIDVLLIASDWRRPEKNLPLAQKLLRRLKGLRAHVVGDGFPDSKCWQNEGVVDRRDRIFDLLGRARCVVSVSHFDMAPCILFEAAAMGCNIVASPNCGNSELCYRDFLSPTCRLKEFVAAVGRAIQAERPSRLERFLGGYVELQHVLRDVVRRTPR